jgi:hypothetical protein
VAADQKSILRELARRQEEERCRFYVPNAKVEAFIKKTGAGGSFINLLIAANGVGKTAVLAEIIANIMWGPQSEWFDQPLFRNWPYEKHLRVVTEANDLGETGTIDKEINYWWPKGRWTASKAGKNYNFIFKSDTGFMLDKFSFAQEPKEFESATLGAIFFNEPPSEDIFGACVGRMRKGGRMFFHMTPLFQSAWVQDRLIDSHDQDTTVITADIEDACIEHGIRGHLKHEDIERMMKNWKPEEIEARAHGKFMHLSGVIYGGSFKREFHVVPDDVKPPLGSQWFTVVDPARGKPWAIAVGWVDPRGQIVIDDEYPKEDWLRCQESVLTIRDYSDIIKIMEAGKYVEWRIIDRHFANSRNDYGTTLKQDLADKFGLEFRDSYSCEKEVDTGIQKVKDYLGFNMKMPMDAINFPRIRIKERCKNTIRAVERWPRNPKTLAPDDHSPYKDHADLVRYACMANMEIWVPRQMPQQTAGYVLGR